jgi:hypothetical protein
MSEFRTLSKILVSRFYLLPLRPRHAPAIAKSWDSNTGPLLFKNHPSGSDCCIFNNVARPLPPSPFQTTHVAKTYSCVIQIIYNLF